MLENLKLCKIVHDDSYKTSGIFKLLHTSQSTAKGALEHKLTSSAGIMSSQVV